MKKLTMLVSGLSLFVAAAPVRAHHSFTAEFDAAKPVKLTGTVTKIEWTNPHAYFFIDVRDESGKVTNWALARGSHSGLMRQGWVRTSLTIGDVVTVDGSRAKDGSNVANAKNVTLANG